MSTIHLHGLDIIQILQGVRDSMMRSAECHSSAAPLSHLDLSFFRNATTACEMSVKQLKKSLNCTEELYSCIEEFEKRLHVIKYEVLEGNPEYWNEGPLVNCLAALFLKGDTIFVAMKKRCSPSNQEVFGQEWIEREMNGFIRDVTILNHDLDPCYEHGLKRHEAVTAWKQQQMALEHNKGGDWNDATNLTNQPVDVSIGNQSERREDEALVDSGVEGALHTTRICIPERDSQKPPFDRPLLKGQNYHNLPQFTGLPSRTQPILQKETMPLNLVPAAEQVYPAPLATCHQAQQSFTLPHTYNAVKDQKIQWNALY